MNYIVMDLEFNQYFDFNDGRGRDEPLCPFEIMQLGAVILDAEFNEAGRFTSFIRPRIYKRLHPFVRRITGITPADLRGAPLFEDVYHELVKFIGPGQNALCVWGVNDINLLYKNILYYQLNSKLLTKKYIDAQEMATAYFNMTSATSVGLKTAAENLGLETDIAFHNALNDAIYTAEVFRQVKPGEIALHTFNLSRLSQAMFAIENKINNAQLTAVCERELGRQLSDKEKHMALRVYLCGRERMFDLI